MLLFSYSFPFLEPVRSCFPTNRTLHGKVITASPSCEAFQLNSTSVKYCTCDSDLCNGHLYDYRDIRVKRDKTEVPNDFMFPFEERTDGQTLSVDSLKRSVKCYSCGSLFNRDTPNCPQFDNQNETQRATCKPGEACLLYEWRKSKTERGKTEKK